MRVGPHRGRSISWADWGQVLFQWQDPIFLRDWLWLIENPPPQGVATSTELHSVFAEVQVRAPNAASVHQPSKLMCGLMCRLGGCEVRVVFPGFRHDLGEPFHHDI